MLNSGPFSKGQTAGLNSPPTNQCLGTQRAGAWLSSQRMPSLQQSPTKLFQTAKCFVCYNMAFVLGTTPSSHLLPLVSYAHPWRLTYLLGASSDPLSHGLPPQGGCPPPVAPGAWGIALLLRGLTSLFPLEVQLLRWVPKMVRGLSS